MRRVPRAWPAYFVLILALTATAAVTRYVASTVEAKDRDRFENAVQTTGDALRTRMETYVNVLLGGAGLFAASDIVTRAEFRAFVERLDLAERYPGIQGVGFSFRVRPGGDRQLEEWMREQGIEDFRVWPEGDRDEKHSILHLEPLDRRNRAAIGYDMFSEPVRREAMSRARDTGRPAASGGVTLVQEIDEDEKQMGFLIYVPVYSAGMPTRTVDERRAALVGFVYSPFRVGDLLAGIFGTQERPRVTFEVYDGSTTSPDALLGRSERRRPARSSREPVLETTLPMEIAGRLWTVRLRTTSAFADASQHGLAGLVAGGGLAFSLLLFTVAWLQWRAREAAERLAAELRESEQALREANRNKDEFLAMLGHELRNPLGATSNAVAILRHAHSGEDAFERALDVVDRQVRVQNRLLADLLDVSRVTTGRLQLERQVLDLGALVRNTVAAHRAAAEKDGHELELRPAAEPLAVEGDPARLDQVVSNLLSNAFKYTPAGGHVRVSVRSAGDQAEISVQDDGVGMSEELVATIFEPFVQGTRSLDRSQGGLGLGLTLVRRLVEMHGGSVDVRSPGAGKGSEFLVRLPRVDVSRLPDVATSASEARGGLGRRVLVIEDIDDARESLADLLESWGCHVRCARDGAEGLAAADADPPDVAIVDIGLPGIDGFQVARELRTRRNGRAIRLIALTGYGQPADRRAALEAGFDVHLVKPLDPEELRRLL